MSASRRRHRRRRGDRHRHRGRGAAADRVAAGGPAWLLDGLWKALGVDSALRIVLGGHRIATDVERVLFGLVANRALDRSSKPAAAEWASCDVAIPGLDRTDDDQAYRAVDLAGSCSTGNLAYLRRAGGHYIAGERMRDGSAYAAEALSRQGRLSRRLPTTCGRRGFACFAKALRMIRRTATGTADIPPRTGMTGSRST